MIKKIMIGAVMLLTIASICFGALFVTLYFSKDTAIETFVSTHQDGVVGSWEAIKSEPTENGSAFETAGKIFEFTSDYKMKYYEDGAEISDKRSSYSWKSETEMILISESNHTERLFVISFDDFGNLIA